MKLSGLNIRIQKLDSNLEAIEDEIKSKKNLIEESKTLIKKYNEQQKNVRNNREYNSITKEIEFQELEIQLAEKHIKEHQVQIEQKKEVIVETKDRLKDLETHLKHKTSELDAILAETEKEELALLKKSEQYQTEIEERLVAAYHRIRKNVKNGLAVVPIERGASGGSFLQFHHKFKWRLLQGKRSLQMSTAVEFLWMRRWQKKKKPKCTSYLQNYKT